MKFISIELAGYTRITLSGTNYIKLTPTEDIQLILGTNGSGKSSLLNEITPLPSNPNNYLKEGFSVKTILHNGSTYILKSTFSPSQKHSFDKDGVELNQGGTVTVQKELVRQEFGITPEIHELIMSRDRFSQMSPSQRRYWFTQLSSVNYDYAINVFNKIKERHRDTSGAIKLNKVRLVNETSKLIPKEEQELLKVQVEELHNFLLSTSDIRIPIDKPIDVLNNEIVRANSEAIKLSKSLIEQINAIQVKEKYGNDNEVGELLVELGSREKVLSLLLEDLHTRMQKISESLDILKRTGSQGIEDLNRNIANLKQEQLNTQLSKKLLTENVSRNALEALRAIEIVDGTLCSLFSEIPPNGDLKYSSNVKNELEISIVQIEQRVTHLKSELVRLDGKRKHLEEHRGKGQLVCQNCQTPFNFGFSKDEFEQVENLINIYNDEINTLEKSKIVKRDSLTELNDYFSLYKQFKTIKDTYPVLKDLWILIDSNILSNPRYCVSLIDLFKSDIILDKRYFELEEEILDLQNLINARKGIEDQDLEKIKLESENIESNIFSKQSELVVIRRQLKNVQQYQTNVKKVIELQQLVANLDTQLKTLVDDKVETIRRQTVNDGVRYVQSILSNKERQLHELKNQESIIASLEQNIKSLEEDEKCLKILVNELSPTDGLIAEGLFGFIRLFINQMNSFIKKVWSYDMEIMSCELSEDSKVELDYKFPIKKEGNQKPIPDVSNGSTGMKEIIDLAFKVIAIKHLGLNDSPLFLDEFGTTLDYAHRTTIYGIFDYLVNQIQFSQVFLVNHYSDLYGSLKNAEICVLHDSNIEIPKGAIYNKHVIIA